MKEVAAEILLNTSLSSQDRAAYQDSRAIQRILRESRVVAVVGLSTEKTKASNMVGSYLRDEGYRVIPIHPKAEEILGQKCYPNLLAVPEPIDVVLIFRPSHEVQGIVEQAIHIGAKSVWMQLRIIDLEAAKQAMNAGLAAVVDRCMKIEHGRFSGMLHWAGMNTEIISARRPRKA